MRPPRLLSAASLWLAIGCTDPRNVATASDVRNLDIEYALIEGPFDCQTQQLDENVDRIINAERAELLGGVSFRDPIRNVGDARTLFEEGRSSPLVVVYSGHGTCEPKDAEDPSRCAEDAQSKICLEDGTLAANDLLAITNPRRAYVVLILNSCWSAHVDPSRAPGLASVLSASPDLVAIKDSHTLLGQQLAQAQASDQNGDQLVDDRELLESVAEGAELSRLRKQEARTRGALFPKLRRQGWSALPVRAVGKSPCCHSDRLEDDLARLGVPEQTAADVVQREHSWQAGNVRQLGASPHVYWVDQLDDRLVPLARDVARKLKASEGFSLIPGQPGTIILLREDQAISTVSSSQLVEAKAAIEAGHWAASPSENTVRHYGRVSADVVLPPAGRSVPRRGIAEPCLQSFGQCFRFNGDEAKPK